MTDNLKSTHKAPANKKTEQISSSLFDKIIEIITGKGSDERRKQRKLKMLSRDVSRAKSKFYNHKKELILPAFGDLLYKIYRNSQNLSRFFDIKNHSNSIKHFMFDSLMSKEQLKLKEELSVEKLDEALSSSKDIKKTINHIKKQLSIYAKSFDAKTVNQINSTYNQIVNLSHLITYDWYFIVHKFDSNISEDNFNYKPSFESLPCKYLLDDFMVINDYISSVNLDVDLTKTKDYLTLMTGDRALADFLKKNIAFFRSLKSDHYLTKLIKVISKNPDFAPKLFTSKEKIVQEHIFALQNEVKKSIDTTLNKIKKDKLNKTLMDIFSTSIIVRMKYFSQKINDFLISKGFDKKLKYIDPVNYIKAFLLDICKGEIKPRVDFLLIKGNWESNTISSEYSLILEEINKSTAQVVSFDEKCSETEKFGKELRRLAGASKHNPNANAVMSKLIDSMDEEARKLITTNIVLFQKICDHLKVLLEDYNQKAPKIIINFKKINWEYDDFNDDVIHIYKKLVSMITLLKSYLPQKESKKS